MIRRRLHFLVALATALALLLGQHAALAHLVGHGAHAGTAALGEDAEHAAAATLAEPCTGCVAFAAIATGAATSALPSLAALTATADILFVRTCPLRRAVVAAYRSRAPPTH